MTELLFSYGTLQLESVQRASFGRVLPMAPDSLPGFRVETVRITDEQVLATSGLAEHPMLVYTGVPGDVVNGAVLQLTVDEVRAADAYEVDDYHRIAVTLTSGATAWVYVSSEHRGPSSDERG